MRRGLVAVLFVALLVVQPATAAAGNYPSAEKACEQTGDGPKLVAIFPGPTELQENDSQVETGRMAVYPGTTFRVAFCDGRKLGFGKEWSLGKPTNGLEVLDTNERTVTVRVTGERHAFNVSADGKPNARNLEIDVRRTPKVDSELADATIDFEEQSAAKEYEKAERRYLTALANLSKVTSRVNRTARNLNSSDRNVSNVTASVLSSLNESRETVDERATAFYRAAWQTEDADVAKALDAARKREEAADADVKRAMKNYLGSLKSAEESATRTVFLNLGVTAVLGLLAGAVPGWWMTERKLEKVRFDQEVDSSVSYGLHLLGRVGVLAAIAFALTLAALVALGGFDTLGGLL